MSFAEKDAAGPSYMQRAALESYAKEKERECEQSRELLETSAMFLEDRYMRVASLPTDVVPRDLVVIQCEMKKHADSMQTVLAGCLREAQRWAQMLAPEARQFDHIIRPYAREMIQRTADLRRRSLVRAKLLNAQFEALKVQQMTPAQDSQQDALQRAEKTTVDGDVPAGGAVDCRL